MICYHQNVIRRTLRLTDKFYYKGKSTKNYQPNKIMYLEKMTLANLIEKPFIYLYFIDCNT